MSMLPVGFGASGDYTIEESLRFNASQSSYLSRTPASAGNRKTWTWSGWVKRSKLSSLQLLFQQGADQNNSTSFYFNSADTLEYSHADSGSFTDQCTTTAVFRDPSAWYHIVLVVDTIQATDTNRIKIYVNGTLQALGTANYPAQNVDTDINTANPFRIGSQVAGTPFYIDGYITEVNFIDGQALDASSFGETDGTTGVWKPKGYTGTYGTNGFFLDFSDATSATTLGYDYSGNSNNWTLNNFNTTSTSTAYCSMTDTPTPYADGGNYAVLNPLTKGTSNTNILDGNLNAAAASSGAGSNWGAAFSSIAIPTSGKWYVEGQAYINLGVGNNSHLGVVDSATFVPAHNAILYAYTTGEGFDGIYVSLFNDNVQPVSDGVLGTAVGSLTGTTVDVMLAVDVDAGKVWAGYNGIWLNSGNPVAGTGEVALRTFSPTDVVAVGTALSTNAQGMKVNFGQRPFAYTPPTGFKALHTGNLPDSSIVDGSKYFDALLYTGNGSTQSITGLEFQPDWVWIKERSSTSHHMVTDVVRGATTGRLETSNTDAEKPNVLTSFDSSGFSMTANNGTNESGQTYVAWNWKANGAGVSNTDGSITSTVSANPTAGFSVVNYVVPSGGAVYTVGHGLGSAPKMILAKGRNEVGAWLVYAPNFTKDEYLLLNTTGAKGTATDFWGSAVPTSSVFGGKSGFTWNASVEVINYCFAEVESYSKFGSYTGNGSADGPFVYTGFRPAFVMVKRTDSANSWFIFDDKRDPYNFNVRYLTADTLNAEGVGTTGYNDFLSNGFKVRNSGTFANASGGTYIYMAFAENPFKNSLAR